MGQALDREWKATMKRLLDSVGLALLVLLAACSDEKPDRATCPEGKRLSYLRSKRELTANGYSVEKQLYECEDCSECPAKAECARAAGNRRVSVSMRLRDYRDQARQNLLSEEGKQLCSRRGVEIEAVFGRLKQNWGFRRFMLRGLEKVSVEWGLLCMAHNMAKLAA